MNYFIILNTSQGSFLLLTDKSISTFETEQEAIDLFRTYYNSKLELNDPTWNTTIFLYHSFLKPFVIGVDKDVDPGKLLCILTNTDEQERRISTIENSFIKKISGTKVDLEACLKYKVSEIKLYE
jgi:hypothetical protein